MNIRDIFSILALWILGMIYLDVSAREIRTEIDKIKIEEQTLEARTDLLMPLARSSRAILESVESVFP